MTAGWRRLRDKRMLSLIGAFLESGGMEKGWVSPVEEGTRQGGQLSARLSNLVLDELDRELERLRLDPVCKAKAQKLSLLRSRHRALGLVHLELESSLDETGHAVHDPFPRPLAGHVDIAILRVAHQAVSAPHSSLTTQQSFGRDALQGLDQWMRRRLRSVIWTQWKRGSVRFARLRQWNIGTDLAAQTADHVMWGLERRMQMNLRRRIEIELGRTPEPELPACSGNSIEVATYRPCGVPVHRRRDSNSGFRTELENLFGDAKGKGTSGRPTRLKVPMHRSGTHCFVVARKRGNSRGAKGQVTHVRMEST